MLTGAGVDGVDDVDDVDDGRNVELLRHSGLSSNNLGGAPCLHIPPDEIVLVKSLVH